ncbi:MAG TPA: hypothetical protein VJT50_08810 [Pyrinomonadaceae bacterium]|nr:hypothetical protein [Pyrinomonadaceae bacterium]
MERTLDIQLHAASSTDRVRIDGAKLFAVTLASCACGAAVLAGWLPLQVSIVTVFLFAGPHNWFEFRYFLMRLPVRFGKSRSFFIAAFAGIALLTATYVALPFAYSRPGWAAENSSSVVATWNSLLLGWLGLLVWLRGKNKRRQNGFLAIPVTLALCSINWLAPELFSLALVYLHPLIALWFLDRHLQRNRPHWLRTYRRCLGLVAILLVAIILRLSHSASLHDDNGLFWRITQHSGAELLPGISSHMLVSVHVFLEMLHYGVWILALPLIAPNALRSVRRDYRFWDPATIPVAKHPRGFPRIVTMALIFGAFAVALLWVGFAVDYSTTRDIYFTVAMAHVLAEAPFLLKML